MGFANYLKILWFVQLYCCINFSCINFSICCICLVLYQYVYLNLNLISNTFNSEFNHYILSTKQVCILGDNFGTPFLLSIFTDIIQTVLSSSLASNVVKVRKLTEIWSYGNTSIPSWGLERRTSCHFDEFIPGWCWRRKQHLTWLKY